MASRCRDADSIPKVADAGMVLTGQDGQRAQIMHNGLRVVADGYYGKWMTDLIRICRGHHEVQEERLFHEIERRLPADATMIELGGFWSYYSLWFLQDAPSRRAVVIEPEPLHLEVGRQNAVLNNLSPTFRSGFAGGTFDPGMPFNTEKSGTIDLPRYSVHHLMEDEGLEHLSLLHCDIQGAETAVLESCRDLFLSRKIDWVFVSTHAHQISGDPLTHQKCLSILRQCGGIVEAEHDVHESFSGDGLIVVRFCPPPEDWQSIPLSYNRHSQSLFRHLAYDVAQYQHDIDLLHQEISAAANDKVNEPASKSVMETAGILFNLSENGPLGERGASILIPQDSVMFPNIVRDSSWAIDVVEAFLQLMTTDRVYSFIDVGANIGLFSRQLLNMCSNIEKCFCIEPDRKNFDVLRYNLSFASNNVNLYNYALGRRDEKSTFYRDKENIGNYSLNIDAMRGRPYELVEVGVCSASRWMKEELKGIDHLLWKSDTQGYDELIVSETPWNIWEKIDVAVLEMWRIAKPEYDRDAFRARIQNFPNRRLGDDVGVSAEDIENYLQGDDWNFKDLLLWR